MKQPVRALTISGHFLAAMLAKVLQERGEEGAQRVLRQAGVPASFVQQACARITPAQFVAAYKAVAAELDDEMLGLWSRPIRGGTLKYMMLSLLDAGSLAVALYRFTHFWNLLLDDYRLVPVRAGGRMGIVLEPRLAGLPISLLGHELMLKLAHGIVSWLLDKEVALEGVEFAFAQPPHCEDYAFLFPCPLTFAAPRSAIWFPAALGAAGFRRTRIELWPFLRRAPQDWAFTSIDERLLSARVRQYLAAQDAPTQDIGVVARAFGLSVRTLTRRLEGEGRGFRAIRDDLRRDMAVQLLTQSGASVDSVATLVGFDNTAAFCRAFRGWMDATPSAYRKGAGKPPTQDNSTDA